MKSSIKTIGLLAALAIGLTCPLFSQVPDLTKEFKLPGLAVNQKDRCIERRRQDSTGGPALATRTLIPTHK